MSRRPTQAQRILEYIRQYGSISPIEAFSDLGITKLATRISEMRELGVPICIKRCERVNRFGERVVYAIYSLEEHHDAV